MEQGKENQEGAQEVPSPKGLGGAPRLEDGGPAFPIVATGESGQGYVEASGASLRDYFAAKAMAAIITTGQFKVGAAPDISDEAYFYADAMLQARKAGAA